MGFSIVLHEEYEKKVDKILHLFPELNSRKRAVETAIDKLHEWGVKFTKEEREVLKEHAKMNEKSEEQ